MYQRIEQMRWEIEGTGFEGRGRRWSRFGEKRTDIWRGLDEDGRDKEARIWQERAVRRRKGIHSDDQRSEMG